MKTRRIVLAGTIGALIAIFTVAAGTWYQWDTSIKRVDAVLTSNASGVASTSLAYTGEGGFSRGLLAGVLERIVVVPDSGATQPSNNFSLFVYDGDWQDLAQGQLSAACSNTTSTCYQYAAPSAFAGALTVYATGMGSSKGATVRLYFAQEEVR